MPVRIENKTGRRVLLRYNSGVTRYLAPQEVISDVEHVEVKANTWLNHLEAQHIIAVEPPLTPPLNVQGSASAQGRPRATKRSSASATSSRKRSGTTGGRSQTGAAEPDGRDAPSSDH
jgi:hypothetical protein